MERRYDLVIDQTHRQRPCFVRLMALRRMNQGVERRGRPPTDP